MSDNMSSQIQWDEVIVDIARYVYHYEVHKPESFERARLLLLDSLGCAVGSLNDPLLRRMIGPYIPDETRSSGFRLPGTAIEVDPVKGAFDLGTMIRYLDHNDALAGAEWGHPSDNLGSIIAVMGWLGRSSAGLSRGPDAPALDIHNLLVAMIKAYEIEGCFQIANSFNKVGHDHTILVKIASTAVVSWLLGLSEEECRAAISQAWMDGHPLRTYRAGHNTIPRKGWAAGDACMRAVHLAWLTKAGQPGAPNPLTMNRWGFYDCLFNGNQFSLPQAYTEEVIRRSVVKLFACEGHVLTAALAAFHLHQMLRKQGIDEISQHIKAIKIKTQKSGMLITDKPPSRALNNAADRDHDMRFIVALVLVKGHLPQQQDYQNDSIFATDTRIDYLRSITTMAEDPSFTEAYHNVYDMECANAIRIQLKDGSWTEEVIVRKPLGFYDTLDGISLKQKLAQNLEGLFSPTEIENIQTTLQDDLLPVHEWIDLWWRPKTGHKSVDDRSKTASRL